MHTHTSEFGKRILMVSFLSLIVWNLSVLEMFFICLFVCWFLSLFVCLFFL